MGFLLGENATMGTWRMRQGKWSDCLNQDIVCYFPVLELRERKDKYYIWNSKLSHRLWPQLKDEVMCQTSLFHHRISRSNTSRAILININYCWDLVIGQIGCSRVDSSPRADGLRIMTCWLWILTQVLRMKKHPLVFVVLWEFNFPEKRILSGNPLSSFWRSCVTCEQPIT